MPQAMRGLRWRAAWLVALALVFVLWRVVGGSRGSHVIQVQYGMVPELEGATVLIDGDTAGTLQKRGARTLTGFRVDEGEHTVRVVMEACPGDETRVTTGFGAGVVLLVAEVEDYAAGVEMGCRLVLRP